MHGKDKLMMRVLMNRFHLGAPDSFLAALPQEAAKQVLDQEVTSQSPAQVVVYPAELLKSTVHYSWLIPSLKELKMPLRSLLISSLPPETASILSGMTESPLVKAPSPVVQNFLFTMLYEKLDFGNTLPSAFLPETSLSPLLELNKSEMIDLIDYLGIYDLAQELRQIVDKEIIKGVNSALSVKKQRFLKICLHQKEKISVAKLGLKNWKGNNQQLLRVLHRRGLLRLGGALSGQHPDFLWYITHRLDRGRGQILANSYSKKEIPVTSSSLALQVLGAINFIKKMGEK